MIYRSLNFSTLKINKAAQYAVQPGQTIASACRKYGVPDREVRAVLKQQLSPQQYAKQRMRWLWVQGAALLYPERRSRRWLRDVRRGQIINEIAQREQLSYFTIYQILRKRYGFRPVRPPKPKDPPPKRLQPVYRKLGNYRKPNDRQRALGDRLRELRRSRGWSLARSGREVGVSRQCVFQWEKGYGISGIVELVLALSSRRRKDEHPKP